MWSRARIRVESESNLKWQPRAYCVAFVSFAFCAGVISVRPAVFGAASAMTTIPIVTMEAEDLRSFPSAYPIADRLVPNRVVEIRVRGFGEFVRAIVEQCVTGSPPVCANRIPVQFDETGAAQFQYLIGNDFHTSVAPAGGCRVNTGRCSIVVRSLDGHSRSEIQTIFIDGIAPSGTIDVAPSSGLSLDGELVTIHVREFPPGARVNAVLCAAPSAVGERCGTPGPSAPLLVGPDGEGETQLFVGPSVVGEDRIRCFRGDNCGISVASDSVFARAPVVPISFEGPLGARYSSLRLAVWLSLALILLGVAALLIRRTDWAAVGEAMAPEIDQAEYADLDAIIAALPPEEPLIVEARPRHFLLHRK